MAQLSVQYNWYNLLQTFLKKLKSPGGSKEKWGWPLLGDWGRETAGNPAI